MVQFLTHIYKNISKETAIPMKKIFVTLAMLGLLMPAFGATTHKKHHAHHKHHTSKKYSKKASITKSGYSQSVPASIVNVPSTIAAEKINTNAISNQPRLYSYSAMALDADSGEVFVSKNPTAKLPIASITKLMTAMVVIDSEANLDEYVTISSADIDTLRNTFSRLKVGMQLRRRDLLLLALMSSENRAAYALGRTAYPGGIRVFIQKMNDKAKSLGMMHTQFYDPTGLTIQNKSTAEDLTKMVQAAFEYDLIKEDTTTKGADVMLGHHYTHHYMNSDALVRVSKFPISLSKTGFINEAGHCLVLFSKIGGKSIVMVFLNSAGKSGRLVDAIVVKNYIQKIA
jgi:D-alanyl-D-alanine endopeptidase (penicillin-binding protein 7)